MKNEQVISILLAGVGGQGTILVSQILTGALIEAGYDVKMSEIHGMAQRGGSVSTTVRYGPRVDSPLVGKGAAQVLVAFEQMEAVRWSDWLTPDGLVIVNDYKIRPLPVASGAADYPEACLKALSKAYRTVSLDAGGQVLKLGNAQVMNLVMLGALAEAAGLGRFDWDKAMEARIPPDYLEINKKAFEAGRALAREAQA